MNLLSWCCYYLCCGCYFYYYWIGRYCFMVPSCHSVFIFMVDLEDPNLVFIVDLEDPYFCKHLSLLHPALIDMRV